jgi:hypothetical protein
MKKLIMIAVTVAVVIALFGAHHHVQAQAHERLSSPFKGPAGPPIVLTSHTLITTYIDQGDANVTLSSGFTGIDNPVTFNCQSASGCTIGAESSTEVGGQTASGVDWGICTYVDGSLQGNCVFEGPVPNNGTYVNGSFNNVVGVSVGTHTVQAAAYSSAAGVVLGQYNNTYRLYRP